MAFGWISCHDWNAGQFQATGASFMGHSIPPDSGQSHSPLDQPGQSTMRMAGFTRAPAVNYEELLNRDPRWALSEGADFEEDRAVFKALHNIAAPAQGTRHPLRCRRRHGAFPARAAAFHRRC